MEDPFDLCFVLNTRMAARAVTRHADRRFRSFGITATQFSMLGCLLRHPGRSVTQMAETIAMDRTTLSRNLSLLERKGLVSTSAAAQGNGRIGGLTQQGIELVAAVTPVWEAEQSALRARFGEAEYPAVIATLRRLASV